MSHGVRRCSRGFNRSSQVPTCSGNCSTGLNFVEIYMIVDHLLSLRMLHLRYIPGGNQVADYQLNTEGETIFK